MDNDLISRSELLELYADTDEIKFDVCNVPIPVVRQNILDMPAVDAVIPVRCKDCKHLMFSDCYGECRIGHIGIVQPDDFCSRGERRADE